MTNEAKITLKVELTGKSIIPLLTALENEANKRREKILDDSWCKRFRQIQVDIWENLVDQFYQVARQLPSEIVYSVPYGLDLEEIREKLK